MIERGGELPVKHQCELLGLNRSVDRNPADTLGNPPGYQLPMLLGAGNSGSGPLGLADRGRERGILR
jgi:hypothetical protein